MGLARGLVGFGMTAAVAVGTGLVINEAAEANLEGHKIMDCIEQPEVSGQCDDLFLSQGSIDHLNGKDNVYTVLGFIGSLATIAGGVGTFYEIFKEDDEPGPVGKVEQILTDI